MNTARKRECPVCGAVYSRTVQSCPADGSSLRDPRDKFDAFLSYRRDKGGDLARLIQSRLREHGKRVFLDVDGLGSGKYEARLLYEIQNAPYFIPILTPECLERCHNEDDWVRREVVHAIACKRHVIPVMVNGFKFPEPEALAGLPKELGELAQFQAVTYVHALADASVAQIVTYMGGSRSGVRASRLRPLAVAFAISAALLGLAVAALSRSSKREDMTANTSRDAGTIAGGTMTIGPLQIPDVLLHASCRKGEPVTERFAFSFEQHTPRPDPPIWRRLEAEYLPKLIADHQSRGRPFFDGRQVDLITARLDGADRSAGAKRKWFFGVAETSYYRFAAMSNSLDRNLGMMLASPTMDEKGKTLREVLASRKPVGIEDVDAIQAPVVVGTVTVVVLGDGQMLLLERTRQYQVGKKDPGQSAEDRTRIHFIGEGAVPEDHDDGNRYDPFRTASRGLEEELALQEHHHFQELVMTGFFFDLSRWQPVFSFLVKTGLSLGQVNTLRQQALDKHESRTLSVVPWDINDRATSSLLMGRSREHVFASNHAQAAAVLALVYRDGLTVVEAGLAAATASQ